MTTNEAHEHDTSPNNPAPRKRTRFVTPTDAAVRAQKRVTELRRRGKAAKLMLEAKLEQLHEEEDKVIAGLRQDEREILFRLEPSWRPPDPVAVERES